MTTLDYLPLERPLVWPLGVWVVAALFEGVLSAGGVQAAFGGASISEIRALGCPFAFDGSSISLVGEWGPGRLGGESLLTAILSSGTPR